VGQAAESTRAAVAVEADRVTTSAAARTGNLSAPERAYHPRRNLGEWLTPVLRRLAETLLRPRDVRLALSAEPAILDVGRCLHAALVLELLIEKIARHAFHSRGGDILVEVIVRWGELLCCVSNNGDPTAAALGQRLVRSLASELGGELDWRAGAHGSVALVRFPLDMDAASRRF
jgi:two-component sensor histidine kinase